MFLYVKSSFFIDSNAFRLHNIISLVVGGAIYYLLISAINIPDIKLLLKEIKQFRQKPRSS